MNRDSKIFLRFSEIIFVFIAVLILQLAAPAQGVKRVVIIKIDGLQGDYVDRFVKERDPATGKSVLPWFEEIFYKNGTRLANFYTRGMSLSGPSWSVLDTGQHLQIKGNVEFDRFTLRSYDYLNFVPLQLNYSLKKKMNLAGLYELRKQVDMPGVEVLDQVKIPLLVDAFPYEQRYVSYQLFQRGNRQVTMARGFLGVFPKEPSDFIDEWTIGFNFRDSSIDETEREIVYKLNNNPTINYFDLFNGAFDHVSHHNNDTTSRLNVLKDIDRSLGKIWTAIQASPRAAETAMFVVSDHGFNSVDKIYSQGFNLVNLLASAEGGGHHVITKRRLMLDYSIKGTIPLVPLITTISSDSYYLKGQSKDYPTALIDFDGNERSSIHLRDNDLNVLQILFQQLQSGNLSPALKNAATNAFFDVLDRRREDWQKTVAQLSEELDALHRWIESQQAIIKSHPEKFTPEEIKKGVDKESLRVFSQVNLAVKDENEYRQYTKILSNLLALKRDTFDAKNIKIEDYIAKGAMGERNSTYELQNYVVGLSAQGLTTNSNGNLDFEKSFQKVNYFELFENQIVRNNVQPQISNRPIDFVATTLPREAISPSLPADEKPDEDAIWLYGGADKQALILTRRDADGKQTLRYLPIAHLQQQADGRISFETKQWDKDFPLKMYEDGNLNVPAADKATWLSAWHTDVEWLRATHKTLYSNGIIGLNEQLDSHPLTGFENEEQGLSADDKLIRRFRWFQRRLTLTDFLILANDHWNFDVRGFNPGGNHGSYFRISTNSTLMMAGGVKTNIPRGLTIEAPYDSLDFVPTVLALTGKVRADGSPTPELYQEGFRKFPGRIIQEVINPAIK